MTRDESGAAVVVATALIMVLGLVAVIGVGVGGLFAAHRRVSAAADLAALAAATARERGQKPCAAAASIASRNGAGLVDCAVDAEAVEVVVESEVPGPGPGTVRARARAGP